MKFEDLKVGMKIKRVLNRDTLRVAAAEIPVGTVCIVTELDNNHSRGLCATLCGTYTRELFVEAMYKWEPHVEKTLKERLEECPVDEC